VLITITIHYHTRQPADTVAALWNHLRGARGGELGGHGLLHNHPVYDAGVRGDVNRLLPLAHEQGVGLHHVSVVFCLCRRVADVRIRRDHLPLLKGRGKDKSGQQLPSSR